MFFVHLAGNLGKDPETRFTPSGQKVTTFSVATSHRKGKDKEEVTIWVRVTVWGDRFDKLLSFLKKGSSVIVGGRMNPPNTYVDKEGRTQTSLEITAEMIEFSPFGRSDRATEGQSQQGGALSPQHDQGHSFSNASGQYNQSSAHGSQSMSQGAGHYSQAADDDAIPF